MKFHRGIFGTSTILVIAAATTIGTCQLASAAPVVLESSVSAASFAADKPTPVAADKPPAAMIRAVAPGGTLVIPATATRPSLTVSRSSAGMLTVNVATSRLSVVNGIEGACTFAVTSALFALGAGVVTLVALSGAGIVVAGVFISAAQLGALSAVMGSSSALFGLVGQLVC